MARIYSTYEAKAKLSEIIRSVRGGKRVVIAYRGEPVAEVVPVEPVGKSLADRLKRLQADGIIGQPPEPFGKLAPIAKRPGALKRFLESRD